jgi:hypothetical protein
VILYAHAGHVLLDMLYAAPLLIMIGLLVVGKMRENRSRDEVSRGASGVSPPHDDAGAGS